MEKNNKFIFVFTSKERERLIKEGANNLNDNAYGLVLSWDEKNQKQIPVICGHGGSMWLCRECAERLKKGGDKMTNSIEQKIIQVKSIVQDWPADASTYVLLRSLQEVLIPAKDKLFETTDPQSQIAGKQVLLIINIANSIIEFLDVKKATFK